ncbi:hypothetical protein AB0L70_34310 [Kribbella sp. NPDC051952]|uniref:hypothetical protein n=1 Tax=Kribbella sp. NPDC051952 TaxID=3154851 RepID=UPI0034450D34
MATALLVYFGWARSNEQARQLGLEESVLGMSTRDYVLRSIDTLFVPLLVVGCAGVVWLLVHERISAAVDHRRGLPGWSKRFRWLRISWLVVPAVGLVAGMVWPAWMELIVPLCMTVGILVSSYASVMYRRIKSLTKPDSDDGCLARWHWPLMKLLVGALVALTIFWGLSTFAGVVGRGLADQIVAGLDQRTGVVVYSKQDIQLAGPGVTKYQITESSSAYGFRYDGLRLLQRTGDKFYLLPVGWRSDADGVIALPDDGSVRVEFSTAGRSASDTDR